MKVGPRPSFHWCCAMTFCSTNENRPPPFVSLVLHNDIALHQWDQPASCGLARIMRAGPHNVATPCTTPILGVVHDCVQNRAPPLFWGWRMILYRFTNKLICLWKMWHKFARVGKIRNCKNVHFFENIQKSSNRHLVAINEAREKTLIFHFLAWKAFGLWQWEVYALLKSWTPAPPFQW